MVAHRLRVAAAGVKASARPQLRSGAAGRALHARGADGGGEQASPSGGAHRGRVPATDQRDHAVEVVGLDVAVHVRAPEPQLARRAQHVGDRARRVEPHRRAGAVARGHLAAVPELDRERPVGQRPLDLAAQGGGASAGHGASAYRYGKPAVSGGELDFLLRRCRLVPVNDTRGSLPVAVRGVVGNVAVERLPASAGWGRRRPRRARLPRSLAPKRDPPGRCAPTTRSASSRLEDRLLPRKVGSDLKLL